MLRYSGSDNGEGDPLGGLDESRVEGAFESLANEVAQLGDDENPRAVGQLLRRFGEMTGLELGPKMEDALHRMEAGEDLDSVDADLDESDDSLDDLFRLKRSVLRRAKNPEVDEELYFL